ncbi:MAG: deoxyribodipyrimidine photo-lyase [Deinococcota bacterium]
MPTSVIADERIKLLNDKPPSTGDYVLYWMQQSARAEDNHALEVAVQQANELDKPLSVVFGLMDDYPEANLRHYHFLLEGLQETQTSLARRDIGMLVQHGHPAEVALANAKRACLVVCDCGYLRHQRQWRERVAKEAGCRVIQVESDVVVPIELVSTKAEYAARTIRPKITKHLDEFLIALATTAVKHSSLTLRGSQDFANLDLSDVDACLANLKLDTSLKPVPLFKGGTRAGKQQLAEFLDTSFASYADNRNQPQTNDVSHMSKYLHFGQLSPIYIALKIREAAAFNNENRESYLEELIIRRELPMNFVYYTPNYDSYDCLPDWAKKTLAEHKDDEREYIYDREQLETAQTHDPYWNASMNEMRVTGYMHNYMRMYWGKKILEWSQTPEDAFETTLYLNNKYFLDGRDANSFAGVAWVYGQHDRAWTERAVFGKIRYMNAKGLERKAKPKAYVDKVNNLAESLGYDLVKTDVGMQPQLF